ncbi:hypothetical protein BJV78DRAFT_276172 [Lactifluus subvellereus]|nr:hypothetical protein BJV78DRAFT_276172 [Lactifluus subvellereus]
MNPQGESRCLLTDGYIAWSFQIGPATQHFCNVLGTNGVPPLKALSFPGREGVFLAVDYVAASRIPPHVSDEKGNYFWVLDRKISSGGPVVPQIMPAPLTVSDVRGRADVSDLQFPIFFENVDGKLGIPLEAAAAGRCGTLRNAQEYAQLGAWSTTHICIAWPGHEWFARLVCVRDNGSDTPAHRDDRIMITVATFAHRVGESVIFFLVECKPDPGYTSSDGQLWRIGDGGAQRCNVMIIGAINPSVGSWMPILQFIRHPSVEYDTIADVKNRRINWEAVIGLTL